MTRAALYCRVSTQDQSEHGYSLSSQLASCRAYSEQQGFTVVGEFQDDMSGSTMDRPGLDKIRAAVMTHEIDAVVVYSLDRWSRNLAHILVLREELRRAGVELHFVNRGQVEDTPEGALMHNMEGVIAEYERTLIKARTKRGRLSKALSGKWVGISYPFGYIKRGLKRDTYLEIDEEQAALIRRIFEMYVGVNGTDPLYLLKIAQQLTSEGIPTPRNADGWSPETISRIIKNESYIGRFKYADTVIEVPELAIVSQELFDQAQERAKLNKRKGKYRKHEYLLLGGCFRCTCGRSMTPAVTYAGGKPYYYYRCAAFAKRYLYGCEERLVRVDKADPLIWSWLKELLGDSENLREGIDELNRRAILELSPRKARLEVVEELIEKFDSQLARLSRTLATIESEAGERAIRKELKSIGRQRDVLAHEQALLQGQINQGVIDEEETERILELAASIREELDEADYNTKRYIVERLKLQVQLVRDEESECRRLDVVCAIATEGTSLCLQSTSCSTTFLSPQLFFESSLVLDYI